MADTTYVDYVAPTVNAEWLNEINDHVWHNTPVSGTTVHAASSISNTPAGAIVATTVQAAIDELDSEKETKTVVATKAPIDSPTFTGTITVPQNYNASGASLALQVGGVTKVTIGTQGIEAGSFKPGAVAANDLADGALIENSVNGIGYGTGAGGTVTQATSKLTAVTLNKPTGTITTHNAALAAAATVQFIVNCSLATKDDIPACVVSGLSPNAAQYTVTAYGGATDGLFYIVLKNIGGGSLSDAVIIKFDLLKGASA